MNVPVFMKGEPLLPIRVNPSVSDSQGRFCFNFAADSNQIYSAALAIHDSNYQDYDYPIAEMIDKDNYKIILENIVLQRLLVKGLVQGLTRDKYGTFLSGI